MEGSEWWVVFYAELIYADFILKHQFNFSAGGLSTKSANRKLGWPRGRWCEKDEQAVGFPIAIGSGALFGYFLGKQKVTKNMHIYAIKGDLRLSFA